ncbi:PPOX class F420-dependent oxidoreductase [Microbacterium lushaniae]|uniref:PPOX class F420-dependent oxidoreductase n=1 Tax=Microbacterium lushaniae TaxID=2614639 RepID=A0A5J5JJ54_9MICO|nr:PPOX class F420-dependent oxidoreductase [Microbacterium lushaniae]KAA9152956.1 PPOX class F420-dependent oxidoreductase [Microbacterium lushaniae]KAA9153365.1 PPOX class F420-dependent oxidoreductase [Microbacterium lushaniae]QEW03940.1 PPOX class F420-dependent oxidoreductase [Microbacterium lushaniae]
MRHELAEKADHEYVSLTTYRRTGEPVATPVWMVRDGDRLLVTTGGASGKVKRLRHTPRVSLAGCDARGRVAPDEVPATAHAVVDASPETRERLDAALKAKYGMKYRLLRLGRRKDAASVALVITDPEH